MMKDVDLNEVLQDYYTVIRDGEEVAVRRDLLTVDERFILVEGMLKGINELQAHSDALMLESREVAFRVYMGIFLNVKNWSREDTKQFNELPDHKKEPVLETAKNEYIEMIQDGDEIDKPLLGMPQYQPWIDALEET